MRENTYSAYIIRIIFGLCLIVAFTGTDAFARDAKPPPTPPVIPQDYEEDGSLDNVPDEYIREAWNFNKYCRTQPTLSYYQDCECLAARYLDERLRQPDANRSTIMLSIEGQCPDATQAAGQMYMECMADAPIMPANIPIEVFCECYANTYTKMFEDLAAKPSSQTFVRLKTMSMTICRDPKAAIRIYPEARAYMPK